MFWNNAQRFKGSVTQTVLRLMRNHLSGIRYTSIFSAAVGAVNLLSTSDISSSRELLRRIANHDRPHHLNVQFKALWCNGVTPRPGLQPLELVLERLLEVSYHTIA